MLQLSYLHDSKIKTVSLNDTCEEIELYEETVGLRKKVYIKAKKKITLINACDSFSCLFDKKDLFFANGYQSWTDSFEYSYNDKLRNISSLPKKLVELFAFDSYGDIFFHKYDDNTIHGFDVCYAKGINNIFIGNYNSKTAYLIIGFNKANNTVELTSDIEGISVDVDEKVCIFDYFVCDDIASGIELYNSQFVKSSAEKIFGYTSWYNHYQNINDKIIFDVLNKSTTKFDLFQIDDGYETYVGDWLDVDKNKFPNGLAEIVSSIHSKGMKAGIWLAPFAAETKSKTFKEHPDWFIKNENGKPIKAGANWSGFYALDISKKEVVDYIKEFLTYYVDLGFDFFKLDFLYAVSLGKRNGMSRAQVAEKGYGLLREILKDKLILGCGGVMSTSAEKFDYMRIGPDVSLKFDDVWYMRKMHRERISTKITLRNTIYRSFLNGSAFWNDPDVFLLRDDNIWLNNDQKKALITINALFGGVMMTSDNPKDYDENKMNVLGDALKLFKKAEVINYTTNGNFIDITYIACGKEDTIRYDISKGVITNG